MILVPCLAPGSHEIWVFRLGLNRAVTSQNLGEYLDRAARLRASEFAQQAEAFRAGLEDALPKRVLSLLTWTEMKELICGASSAMKLAVLPDREDTKIRAPKV